MHDFANCLCMTSQNLRARALLATVLDSYDGTLRHANEHQCIRYLIVDSTVVGSIFEHLLMTTPEAKFANDHRGICPLIMTPYIYVCVGQGRYRNKRTPSYTLLDPKLAIYRIHF